MTTGVLDVQARMAAIQSRFAMMQPVQARSAAAGSATAFGAALDDALGQVAPTNWQALRTTGGNSAAGDQLIASAKKYLGVPYVWGGTDPAKGLDCSGFVQRAFRDIGVELPRVSKDQAKAGRPVASLAEAKPGDLLAFDYSSKRAGIDHVGIYVGDGKMIHTNRTGQPVRVEEIKGTPDVIRRVLPDDASVAGLDALGAAAPASVPGGTPFAALFHEVGARHGVSPALLTAVARAESNFNPRAVSHAGAQGLMQLMPGTAKGLGVSDSFDPAQAVDGAARLLKSHLDRFGSVELALAAYNAGPGAVQKYGGVPPYRETQAYVAKIVKELS